MVDKLKSMDFPPEHCMQAAEETNGGPNDDYDTWINNAISKCTQIGAEQVGTGRLRSQRAGRW